MTALVFVGPEQSSWFDFKIGVRLGCMLPPILFKCYLEEILRRVIDGNLQECVPLVDEKLVIRSLLLILIYWIVPKRNAKMSRKSSSGRREVRFKDITWKDKDNVDI